jgi:hypothetical protein
MSKLTRDDNGQVCLFGRMGTTQVIAVGSASGQSNAVAANCTIVRLANSSTANAVYYSVGVNPTATTTTSTMLPPSTTEYIEVNGGDKIAFIRVTAATVSVTQIA